jgi:hypothetical protein
MTPQEESEIGYYDPTPKKETLRQVAEKFAKGVDCVIVKETKTMTPKEKAKELINRQYSLITGIDIKYISELIQLPIGDSHYETAKQSALITVCEIIEQWQYIHTYIANGMGELNPNLKYWYEVEEEITNQQEQ